MYGKKVINAKFNVTLIHLFLLNTLHFYAERSRFGTEVEGEVDVDE